MTNFKEITPQEEWTHNPYHRIQDDWMLLAAQKPDGSTNMMTANWGGVGILWHKPVVYIVVRPQRYTKEFIDAADTFSLSFFAEIYRKELTLCGKQSGRDIDKMAACKFTAQSHSGAPVFDQADTVLICRKLFAQRMLPESILFQEIHDEFYPKKDYHEVYIAEVLKALIKE